MQFQSSILSKLKREISIFSDIYTILVGICRVEAERWHFDKCLLLCGAFYFSLSPNQLLTHMPFLHLHLQPYSSDSNINQSKTGSFLSQLTRGLTGGRYNTTESEAPLAMKSSNRSANDSRNSSCSSANSASKPKKVRLFNLI